MAKILNQKKFVEAPALPVEEALRTILEKIAPIGKETISLKAAAGRILAFDIRAKHDLPLFDNSMMDGYAVRAEDLRAAAAERPVQLRVRQVLAAGSSKGRKVGPGEAARIMTGAPLPPGADAIVMQEQGEAVGGRVLVRHRPPSGEMIRSRGEDVRAGDTILRAGARLRPYEIALLAAQGIARVEVYRRPAVAVLSTGDELCDSSMNPSPGRLRDANRPAILGALGLWGALGVDLGLAPDEPGAIAAKLHTGLARADALMVSGGVSVGQFDHTRAVFSKLGIETVFWRVNIKPGKPFLFGIRRKGRGAPQPVFGLPGNPVSALICLEELVRPALDRMQGIYPVNKPYQLSGRSTNGFGLPQGRRQYLFCEAAALGKGYALRILRPQASHRVGMCVKANALAFPPEGMRRVRPGDSLPFRWLE